MAQELDYSKGLNFSDLASKAQQFVDQVDAQQENPEPAKVEVPQSEAPEGVDPVLPEPSTLGEPTQGKVLELAEDTLVRVKIDGEIQEVPYKEFKDSLQREAAWHKRQQAFAQGKKQLEEYYAQQFAQLEQGARQVKAYEQHLLAEMAKLQKQPQTAQNAVQQQKIADEIATLSEVRQETQQLEKSFEERLAAQNQTTNQQLVQLVAQLKQEQRLTQQQNKFNQGLNDVLGRKEFKTLEVIPNLEQNLRYAVWQLGPQSIEEAVDMAKTVAADWAAKLKTIHVSEQQQVDAKKAKAKLEPSEGSPAAPKAAAAKRQSFIDPKTGKLNHTAMRQAALALLD